MSTIFDLEEERRRGEEVLRGMKRDQDSIERRTGAIIFVVSIAVALLIGFLTGKIT